MRMLVILQAAPWSDIPSRLASLGHDAGQVAVVGALALVVMLVGWGLATALAALVRWALHGIQFDTGVRRLIGARVALLHEPAALAAWATYWLVMAAAALFALETLGLDLGAAVSERLTEVVPRIVTSAVLFAVGALVAILIGGIVHQFMESAGVRAARLQGQLVTAVLTGFAGLLALEQLGFAAQFVMAIGIAAVAAAGLALALAFGLGCRDLARDFIVEYLRSLEDDKAKRPE